MFQYMHGVWWEVVNVKYSLYVRKSLALLEDHSKIISFNQHFWLWCTGKLWALFYYFFWIFSLSSSWPDNSPAHLQLSTHFNISQLKIITFNCHLTLYSPTSIIIIFFLIEAIPFLNTSINWNTQLTLLIAFGFKNSCLHLIYKIFSNLMFDDKTSSQVPFPSILSKFKN